MRSSLPQGALLLFRAVGLHRTPNHPHSRLERHPRVRRRSGEGARPGPHALRQPHHRAQRRARQSRQLHGGQLREGVEGHSLRAAGLRHDGRRRGRLRGGVEGPVERDHGAEVRVLEPVRAVSTGDGREWVERGGAATAEWGRRGGVRRSVRGGGAGGELHGADGGARRAAAHSQSVL